MEISGFSCFMFIFSFLILIAGIYLFTGHKNEVLLWKTPNIKTISKKEVKTIGKWTIISSTIPLIIGIIGMLLNI